MKGHVAAFDVISSKSGACEFAGSPVLEFKAGMVVETVTGALLADITLLDEFGNVFWGASTLVSLEEATGRGEGKMSFALR